MSHQYLNNCVFHVLSSMFKNYIELGKLHFEFLFLSFSFVLTYWDYFYKTACKHPWNKLFELSSCNTISLIRYVSAIICYRRNQRQRYLSFRMYEEKQLCNLFYCYIFYIAMKASIVSCFGHIYKLFHPCKISYLYSALYIWELRVYQLC